MASARGSILVEQIGPRAGQCLAEVPGNVQDGSNLRSCRSSTTPSSMVVYSERSRSYKSPASHEVPSMRAPSGTQPCFVSSPYSSSSSLVATLASHRIHRPSTSLLGVNRRHPTSSGVAPSSMRPSRQHRRKLRQERRFQGSTTLPRRRRPPKTWTRRRKPPKGRATRRKALLNRSVHRRKHRRQPPGPLRRWQQPRDQWRHLDTCDAVTARSRLPASAVVRSEVVARSTGAWRGVSRHSTQRGLI